jgi:prepilin-type N-terminal cleavage/methylation domain-containing protein
MSLIELMVVLVILGIAATLVLPAIADRPTLRLAAAARVVVSELQYAQSRAITTQQFHVVAADLVAQQITLNRVTTLGLEPLTHPTTQMPFVTRFDTGDLDNVRLVSVDADGHTSLAFNELGEPLAITGGGASVSLASPAVITLQSGTETLEVHVQPFTGSVTVPTN